MSRLRSREKCPLHNSFYCVCRQKQRSRQKVKRPSPYIHGVRRVDDPHHPRGYREICTPAELRRRKNFLIVKEQSQNGEVVCIYCRQPFHEYAEIELCHKTPKGLGGATHDDHLDNLALGHARCNLENGSRRIA